MGMNFYLCFNACPHCGRSDDRLHIGKSSFGWCFALHVYPELGINSLDDWRQRWMEPGAAILDEADRVLLPEEMLEWISDRAGSGSPIVDDAWLSANHAELGPHDLVRTPIDGKHCIGHAPNNGTWDLLIGEFS